MATPRSKLETIEGSIPHPYNRPKGCPFHPRCGDAMKGHCDVDLPPLTQIDDKTAVSCFLYSPAKAAAQVPE
jgi:peptide/nickel transport system ATP-binding protein